MFKRSGLAGIVASFSFSTGTLAAPLAVDLHVSWPEGNFHTQGVRAFAEAVAKDTAAAGEAISIKVHSGGALGFKNPELLRSVRNGSLAAADILMGNVEGDDPLFGLTSLPLLVTSLTEARKLYDQTRPLYEEALRRHGARLLYTTPWPASGMFTQAPLNTPDALKGLKIRSYDANSAAFLDQIGARGLAIPFGELFTALQTGMVRGVLTSSVTGVDARLWEVTKHFMPIGYAFPLNMVVISEAVWTRLSPQQQAAVQAAATAAESRQWQRSAEVDAEARALLIRNGINVQSSVPAWLAEKMKVAARVLREAWLARLPAGERSRLALGTSH